MEDSGSRWTTFNRDKNLGQFTEDFDTGDLKDAKALLDELCSQNDLLRVQLRSPTPRQCVHVLWAA